MLCFLCNQFFSRVHRSGRYFTVSCLSCGKYRITRQASISLANISEPYKEAAYIKRRSLLSSRDEDMITIITDNDPLVPNSRTAEQLKAAFPVPSDILPLVVLNLVAAYLKDRKPLFIRHQDTPIFYARNWDDIISILSGLEQQGMIEGFNGLVPCVITPTQDAFDLSRKIIAREYGGVVTVNSPNDIRNNFMKCLNATVAGDRSSIVQPSQLGRELRLTEEDTHIVVDYLIDEGLIKRFSLDGGIQITHEGIKYVERGGAPAQAPVMPSLNNVNFYGSQVQFATINSQQTMHTQPSNAAAPSIEEFKQFLQFLKEHIEQSDMDTSDKEEAADDIAIMEKNLNQPEPKIGNAGKRLKTMLKSFAEKTLVSAAAARFPEIVQWALHHIH